MGELRDDREDAHLPNIGGMPLQALTPSHLNRTYGELLEGGGRGGRPLSARTVRLTYSTVRKALADAVRWGRLARNVADLADPPSAKAERESRRGAMRTWSAEQLGAFLAHVAEDRLAALWHLAATTGLRPGELAGLRWQDVHLDAGRLAVSRGLVSVAYAVVESGTKSGKVRVVDPGHGGGPTRAPPRPGRRAPRPRGRPTRTAAWCSAARTASRSTPSGSR